MLRWFILMRYPEGVSREKGDDWFLTIHAPEVARQPGLSRFFSYRVIDELSYDEIGVRLQCSPGTARARVFRGLQTMRSTIAKGAKS